MGAGRVLMWGPLPHTCSLQAAAAPAQPLQSAHCFGVTPQPPEIQRNLLGMDSVEMKLLQLTEAASEIVHCCTPAIPLQMATAAAALGGELSMFFLLILILFGRGIPREKPCSLTPCCNTECIIRN